MKTDLVVAGFIFHKNKLLLIHHKKLDLWLPVGGHIDENETPDEALLREIKEEVGIKVEILGKNDFEKSKSTIKNLAVPFHANIHSVGDHNHCCFFYICKAKSNKIKSNEEIKDFGWFSKKDLDKKHIRIDVRAMGLKGFELVGKLK